jgi:hypothetical protein
MRIYIYIHMGFMWYGEYMSGAIIYYVAFRMRKFLRGLFKALKEYTFGNDRK